LVQFYSSKIHFLVVLKGSLNSTLRGAVFFCHYLDLIYNE